MKWYDVKDENEDGIDFLRTNERELLQKIPTLQRRDHAEYISFRM